jgi:hypothetical protein
MLATLKKWFRYVFLTVPLVFSFYVTLSIGTIWPAYIYLIAVVAPFIMLLLIKKLEHNFFYVLTWCVTAFAVIILSNIIIEYSVFLVMSFIDGTAYYYVQNPPISNGILDGSIFYYIEMSAPVEIIRFLVVFFVTIYAFFKYIRVYYGV